MSANIVHWLEDLILNNVKYWQIALGYEVRAIQTLEDVGVKLVNRERVRQIQSLTALRRLTGYARP